MSGVKDYKNYSHYNMGICLLRMMACFLVIAANNWEINTPSSGALGWLYYLRNYSVSIFMILAFCFCEKMIATSDTDRLLKRLVKLIVPLFAWAIIYWIFYKVLSEVLYPGYNISVKDLLWQMFTGNSIYLNSFMWFSAVLIVLTVLIFVIAFITNKFHNPILGLLAILCIYAEYAGLMLFLTRYKAEIAGSVGRLHEMFPLAVLGYMIAYFGLVEKSRKHWIITMLFAVVALWLIRRFGVFADPSVQTFGYAGIKMIVTALLLVFLFFAPPLEKLPKFIRVIIEWLTKYTLGIYCMQSLVATLLHYYISHRNIGIELETYTIFDCIRIYAVCYAICFLISRIPCKWTRMLVE